MRCEDWQRLAVFCRFLPFFCFLSIESNSLLLKTPQAVALHLEQTKNQQPPNPEVETFLAQPLGYNRVTSVLHLYTAIYLIAYVFAQKDQ